MLQQKLQNKRIILASQSPRRQELLKGLALDFEVQLKPVEENYSDQLKREEITNYLAKQKASAFTELEENTILITSDTIVWFEDQPLEKPKGREEAIQMLQTLSGKPHEVFTSICLTSGKKQQVDFEITKVFFKKLTLEEIVFYVDHFKPFDKAGAYGIQDWLGFIGVEKIEGSYVNVMGLPTHLLYRMLNQFV